MLCMWAREGEWCVNAVHVGKGGRVVCKCCACGQGRESGVEMMCMLAREGEWCVNAVHVGKGDRVVCKCCACWQGRQSGV